MKKNIFVLSFFLSLGQFVFASEVPSFCSPNNFYKLEVSSPLNSSDNKGLKRMHAFKLGQTTLVGVAVGDSKTPSTQKLALALGTSNIDQNKYCTWYFATGNETALSNFISHPIQTPFSISVKKSAQIFMNAIGTSFFKDGNLSFMNCAQDQHYIAMGCTEQKHRGPTVFGMLLSFAGCAPTDAATIVNTVWGLNGLNPDVRNEAIKAAYEYGNQNPNERTRFADLLK